MNKFISLTTISMLTGTHSQLFYSNNYCKSDWTTWSSCTCNSEFDTYTKYRSREVLEQYQCELKTETTECSQIWSTWSDCDTTECGKVGRQTRTNTCGRIEYQNCLKECATSIEDYQNILNYKCQTWAEWSGWSQCSNSCNGFKTRKRVKMCSQENENQFEECRNWAYGDESIWSEWNGCEILSKCEPTRGRRMRTKQPGPCDHQLNRLGFNHYELEDCMPNATDIYQTELSLQFSYFQWSAWSECSLSKIGFTTKNRTRQHECESNGRQKSKPQFQVIKCKPSTKWSTKCYTMCDKVFHLRKIDKQYAIKPCTNTEKTTKNLCDYVNCYLNWSAWQRVDSGTEQRTRRSRCKNEPKIDYEKRNSKAVESLDYRPK